MLSNKPYITLFFICLLVFVITACESPPSDREYQPTFEYSQPYGYEGVPVILTLKASAKEITIADDLLFRIEIELGEGADAEIPDLKQLNFGQFEVSDVAGPFLNTQTNGKRIRYIEYTLSPLLSGEYTIAPITIEYTLNDKLDAETGEPEVFTMTTDEITITVTSLGIDDPALAEVRSIQPPMLISRYQTSVWVYVTIGISFIFITLLILWLIRRRKKKVVASKRIPAHEIAYKELEKLRASGLLEEGKIKEFYYAISEILRRYIENRFGIQAPDRTTEEFIQEASTHPILSDSYQHQLKEFLEHCDVVKYAKHIPQQNEIQQTINVTTTFIEKTKIKREVDTPKVNRGAVQDNINNDNKIGAYES